MIDKRSLCNDHQSSTIHSPCHGHTLVEVATVALILLILACVAVPRLNLGAVWGAKADAVVQRLVADLRLTRAQAITHAATSPAGFALVMSGAAPYPGYEIVERHEQRIVLTGAIPPGVRCGGGRRFEFGPLGNLQDGSDSRLDIRTEGKAYRVDILPATGAVTWSRIDEGLLTKD